MFTLNFDTLLAHFWSPDALTVNALVFLNLLGALLLGLVVGYERSFNGRAAGMRTYGLVCMASAALVVITGFPTYWFGGQVVANAFGDPTRVIQGIVTGVGFLGAGVIMKEGFSISGLTTAASIWASSAIGILVGVGFYAAAILLALLSAASMMWISRLEAWLPSHAAIAVSLQYAANAAPDVEAVRSAVRERGYKLADGSFSHARNAGLQEWRFVIVAIRRDRAASVTELSSTLGALPGVENFSLSYARN